MSYLCDYVSLLAIKKKKNKQYALTVNHSWHFFLSSLRTVGTVFHFEKEEGGIKAISLMLHFK